MGYVDVAESTPREIADVRDVPYCYSTPFRVGTTRPIHRYPGDDYYQYDETYQEYSVFYRENEDGYMTSNFYGMFIDGGSFEYLSWNSEEHYLERAPYGTYGEIISNSQIRVRYILHYLEETTVSYPDAHLGEVRSNDRNAYPDNGVQDGYFYEYMFDEME